MCNTLIIIEMYLTPHYYAPDGRGKRGYDFLCIKPSIQHTKTKRSTYSLIVNSWRFSAAATKE